MSMVQNFASFVEMTLFQSSLANDVCSSGADFKRVIQFVSSDCDSYSVGVGFHGSVCDNQAHVGYLSSHWDFILVDEEHGVSAGDFIGACT
jgi:hypothetical protein